MKYISRYQPSEELFVNYLSKIKSIAMNETSVEKMLEKALIVRKDYKEQLLADDDSFVFNTKLSYNKEEILAEKEHYVNLLLKKGMQKYHLEK